MIHRVVNCNLEVWRVVIMSIKIDLIAKGYFPEHLPPSFNTEGVAQFLYENENSNSLAKRRPGWDKKLYKSSTYNSAKSLGNRRIFSINHPVTACKLANFVSEHWSDISKHLSESKHSNSILKYDMTTERVFKIDDLKELENKKFSRLSSYKYIVRASITRLFQSLYTHAIPWAFHGKNTAKLYRNPNDETVYFNKADQLIRNGQDGQTKGIPIGSVTSLLFAEIVGQAIDKSFESLTQDRLGAEADIEFIRHFGDVWIGANSTFDSISSLQLYREAAREFELEINDIKSNIDLNNFEQINSWEIEITQVFENFQNPNSGKNPERLREALEYTYHKFDILKEHKILNHILRLIDNSSCKEENWDIVEPFLMKVFLNSDFTIDTVIKFLIWNHIVQGGFNQRWCQLFELMFEKYSSLGHDNEVCWILYACQYFDVRISEATCKLAVRNCGPMVLVSIVSCVKREIVTTPAANEVLDSSVMEDIIKKIEAGSDMEAFWPVYIMMHSSDIAIGEEFKSSCSLLKLMYKYKVSIYNDKRLTGVFDGVEKSKQTQVKYALENTANLF